jgi:hypothetical protein
MIGPRRKRETTRTSGLVVICGLPGTGKSSVAIPLARKLSAAYLRIEPSNKPLSTPVRSVQHRPPLVTPPGCALAGAQLRVGPLTVAKWGQPAQGYSDAWQRIATQQNCWILEAELVCSDESEHQRRVELRRTDIPKLILQHGAE